MNYLKKRYPVLHWRLALLWVVFIYLLLPIFILISLPFYHDNQWFSWVKKPNFEKMFIDCVNESWRSKYIDERSKEIPKIRKSAKELTKKFHLTYQQKLEREALKKKHARERGEYNTWLKDLHKKNPQLAKRMKEIELIERKQWKKTIARPMKDFRIYVSITEKLKSVSDKSYCKNLIITGKYSYTFQDRRWSPASSANNIGRFSRPRYQSESLNGYLKKYQFKAMFRDFMFGEDRNYWQTILSKAGRNM